MKLRTYLYLTTIGQYKLTSRERKLIKRGFTVDAAQSIIERTDHNRAVKILQSCVGLSAEEAKHMVQKAMLL